MDNVIHVNFAKRHAQRKAEARLWKLECIVGVNSDGLLVFTMGVCAGILMLLGIAALF
jgi:hypothetical protein